ncbi:hypothetical protein A2853_02025 [Candidatus Kaiserbacteria bacterium RIFCSPHIGHO2_01_FULL_55_17]|uniref:Uncharacterized protein n=1 Tax=Candidatus Kaiserbacteria bacterium RIFCSPHIGHO2_01_FULL_55_17 TaxID=1798484 RepID=A0A1F6DBQ1_9BACT|nr:MAG: hypothetical protein A2853_02025 [Candidatus Kaiserbacteria bacterium RIFCSPHIGHO2_01_FULL_55_17]
MQTTSIVRYVLIAAIVLILAALGGWYFFIRAKQAEIKEADTGRGTSLPEQSLGSAFGSTYENIVSSLSSMVSGERSADAQVQRLAQVNKSQTAGAGFVESGTSTRLRFVERGTGFIFDVIPETLALERLTNTLILRTYEAFVAADGRLLVRGTEEDGGVTTIVASVAATSTSDGSRMLTQQRLPNGIRSITANTTGREILYVVEGSTGAVASRAAWDGTKAKEVFASAISGWQLHWLGSERIILVQNPSDNIPGYSYEVQKNGAFVPLLRAIPGLTLLPHPSSRALLYGASGGTLTLFARTSATSTSGSLPIRTTADKCVWDPKQQFIAYCAVPQSLPAPSFLDRWYRGEVHTADAWWRVDAGAASAELLFSPGNAVLDVERPVIDNSGNYIAFVNAVDKSLWLLRIEEQ